MPLKLYQCSVNASIYGGSRLLEVYGGVDDSNLYGGANIEGYSGNVNYSGGLYVDGSGVNYNANFSYNNLDCNISANQHHIELNLTFNF